MNNSGCHENRLLTFGLSTSGPELTTVEGELYHLQSCNLTHHTITTPSHTTPSHTTLSHTTPSHTTLSPHLLCAAPAGTQSLPSCSASSAMQLPSSASLSVDRGVKQQGWKKGGKGRWIKKPLTFTHNVHVNLWRPLVITCRLSYRRARGIYPLLGKCLPHPPPPLNI